VRRGARRGAAAMAAAAARGIMDIRGVTDVRGVAALRGVAAVRGAALPGLSPGEVSSSSPSRRCALPSGYAGGPRVRGGGGRFRFALRAGGAGAEVTDEDEGRLLKRMERFTKARPGEVLLARYRREPGGEEDEVIVYRGASSSLVRRTEREEAMSVLAPRSRLASVDWMQGPFKPTRKAVDPEGTQGDDQEYFKKGLTRREVELILRIVDEAEQESMGPMALPYSQRYDD